MQTLIIEAFTLDSEPNSYYDNHCNLIDIKEAKEQVNKVQEAGGVGLLEIKTYTNWTEYLSIIE